MVELVATRFVAIGDVVQQIVRVDPSKETSREFTYIDLGSVDQERKVIRFTKQVSGSEAPSRARQVVNANDVLVSTVRPNLNGVASVPASLDGSIASTGFCVLRPMVKHLDPRYLFHWVQSPAFVADMVRKATGASYPAVSDKVVFASQMPLPFLPEQRRIAAILDKANELRAKRRQAIANLEELQNSVVEECLGAALSQSQEIPFHQLAMPVRGAFVNGPFGSDLLTSELTDHGVPVIYIRDISSRDYQRVSSVFVSRQKASELQVCRVEPGDVLIAKVGDPPGAAAIYPEGGELAIVTQDVIRIRPNSDVATSEFIVAYLNSGVGRHRIEGITVQATRARIGLGDLKRMHITVPPIEVQRRIAERVRMLSVLKERHRSALRSHEALFAALQHRAFNGELKRSSPR